VIVPEEVTVSVEGGAWFASEVIDAPDSPPVPDAPGSASACRARVERCTCAVARRLPAPPAGYWVPGDRTGGSTG
jgi:hypothetical protein